MRGGFRFACQAYNLSYFTGTPDNAAAGVTGSVAVGAGASVLPAAYALAAAFPLANVTAAGICRA